MVVFYYIRSGVIRFGKKRERVILRCVKLIIKCVIAMIYVKGFRFEQATKEVKSSKERSGAPVLGVCGDFVVVIRKGCTDLKSQIVKILIKKTFYDDILIYTRV